MREESKCWTKITRTTPGIQITAVGDVYSLVIEEVTHDKFTAYKCVATNSVGETETTATLHPICKSLLN